MDSFVHVDLAAVRDAAIRLARGQARYDVRDPGRPVPFEALWMPLVAVAADRLAPRLPQGLHPVFLGVDPQGPLRRLLEELSRLGTPAAFEAFGLDRRRELSAIQVFGGGGGRATYDAFVQDILAAGLEPLWLPYPALAPTLLRHVEKFVAATAEIFDRFSTDRETIGARLPGMRSLGELRSVQTSLSDAHNGGRSVARLVFDDGRAVYYKPRPVDMEAGYVDFIAWFNARRGSMPSLVALEVLARETHGWMQEARPAPCQDKGALSRFYLRTGMMLALADLFCAVDLHHENIVASGEHPLLVDLETLFHPPGPFETDAAGLERTEMLPRKTRGVLGEVYVLSGLGLVPIDTSMQVYQRGWRDVNRDTMAPCHHAGPWPRGGAVPLTADGRTPAIAEWVAQLTAGFTSMHAFFLARQEEIWAPGGPIDGAFRGGRTRFVPRGTRVYAELLRRATLPRAMEDERGARGIFDMLSPKDFTLAALYPMEVAALHRMEVPYFRAETDSTVVHADGHAVRGLIAVSGLDIARDRSSRVDPSVIRERAGAVALALWDTRYAERDASAPTGVTESGVDHQ